MICCQCSGRFTSDDLRQDKNKNWDLAILKQMTLGVITIRGEIYIEESFIQWILENKPKFWCFNTQAIGDDPTPAEKASYKNFLYAFIKKPNELDQMITKREISTSFVLNATSL